MALLHKKNDPQIVITQFIVIIDRREDQSHEERLQRPNLRHELREIGWEIRWGRRERQLQSYSR